MVVKVTGLNTKTTTGYVYVTCSTAVIINPPALDISSPDTQFSDSTIVLAENTGSFNFVVKEYSTN